MMSQQVTDLEHPGGRVGAFGDLWHAGNTLKVGHQLGRALAGGAEVDCAATALQQQQLIKGLHITGTQRLRWSDGRHAAEF